MRKIIAFSVAFSTVLILTGTEMLSAKGGPPAGSVTYVAKEAIYINAGTDHGINVGDTLAVVRARAKKDTLALLVVQHLSHQSAACRVIGDAAKIKTGDRALLPKGAAKKAATKSVSNTYKQGRPSGRSGSRLKGDIAISLFSQKDVSGSGRSWVQPGLRSRFIIDDFIAKGLALRLRTHSRVTYRAYDAGGAIDRNDWNNQVYEFGLMTTDRDSHTQWGIGRVSAPEVRGMGFIDGAFFIRRISPHYRAGIAIGTVPDLSTSAVRLNRRKMGLVVTHNRELSNSAKMEVSAALSTEVEESTSSRDFLYLQSVNSFGSWLTVTQSMEIDWNRSWRYEKTTSRLGLTNYFFSVNAAPARTVSTYFTYDMRKNILRIENADTPDSLLDLTPRSGLRAGLRLRPFRSLRLALSTGARYREDNFQESQFTTFSFFATRMPAPRHTLSATFTWANTEFSKSFRPTLTYRFPFTRTSNLSISGGGTLQRTSNSIPNHYYYDVTMTRRFGFRYVLITSLRQNIGGGYDSIELYGELELRI